MCVGVGLGVCMCGCGMGVCEGWMVFMLIVFWPEQVHLQLVSI